jgi:putative Ca2+/H+ antiporter (TMEM165/GDT1 family)
MEAFFVSFGLVALAEIGDKTQFLALVLAARFRRPWPIVAGISVAALLSHLAAGALGAFIGLRLEGPWLRWVIAASFFAIGIWSVLPEKADGAGMPPPRLGVFGTTVCTFFIAELGDRTQIATIALAAHYAAWLPVVAGTTWAMIFTNVPAVILGGRLHRWVSLRILRWGATLISVALGIAVLIEG